MTKNKQLMRQTDLQGCGGATSAVRTIEQENGSFLTVAYLPAGVDDFPMIERYAGEWQPRHDAMVARAKQLIGA